LLQVLTPFYKIISNKMHVYINKQLYSFKIASAFCFSLANGIKTFYNAEYFRGQYFTREKRVDRPCSRSICPFKILLRAERSLFTCSIETTCNKALAT